MQSSSLAISIDRMRPLQQLVRAIIPHTSGRVIEQLRQGVDPEVIAQRIVTSEFTM